MWAGLFPCRRTWVSRTDLKSWSRMRHEEMIFNIVARGVMEPVRAPWRISESVSKSTSRIPTSHAKSIPSSMENLWVYFKVHVSYPYVPCKINSLFHGLCFRFQRTKWYPHFLTHGGNTLAFVISCYDPSTHRMEKLEDGAVNINLVSGTVRWGQGWS